jgi:hypothetical protein
MNISKGAHFAVCSEQHRTLSDYWQLKFPQTLLFASMILLLFMSGCTATREAEQQTLLALENTSKLQNENTRLNAELQEQSALVAKLQMELVQMQERVTRLLNEQKKMANEITENTIRIPAANTKVETVAYLAEIATEIESAKQSSQTEDIEVFDKAELLLDESNSELTNNHFEHAALLAAQAMALVNTLRLNKASEAQPKTRTYSDFLAPLELKFAKRSNIRKAPGTQAALIDTCEPGTRITALGHKGDWIKVLLPDGKEGWVYYSLLSVPELLHAPKKLQPLPVPLPKVSD